MLTCYQPTMEWNAPVISDAPPLAHDLVRARTGLIHLAPRKNGTSRSVMSLSQQSPRRVIFLVSLNLCTAVAIPGYTVDLTGKYACTL